MTTTGVLLLARTGSTRLPGKVLKPLGGKPVLEQVVRRLLKVPGIGRIVVATTETPADDRLADFCRTLPVELFRGSEDNVLDRCTAATEAFGLDTVVRIGSDCPLVDPPLVAAMLERWREEQARGRTLDYLSNTLERTYPVGLDVEIFARHTFHKIAEAIRDLPEEERRSNESNVIPHLHQHPESFPALSHTQPMDLSHLRWTLDTPEDYDLISRIYDALYPDNPDFTAVDILELLGRNPEWSRINAAIVPRTGHWTPGEQEKLRRRFTGQEEPGREGGAG